MMIPTKDEIANWKLYKSLINIWKVNNNIVFVYILSITIRWLNDFLIWFIFRRNDHQSTLKYENNGMRENIEMEVLALSKKKMIH